MDCMTLCTEEAPKRSTESRRFAVDRSKAYPAIAKRIIEVLGGEAGKETLERGVPKELVSPDAALDDPYAAARRMLSLAKKVDWMHTLKDRKEMPELPPSVAAVIVPAARVLRPENLLALARSKDEALEKVGVPAEFMEGFRAIAMRAAGLEVVRAWLTRAIKNAAGPIELHIQNPDGNALNL